MMLLTTAETTNAQPTHAHAHTLASAAVLLSAAAWPTVAPAMVAGWLAAACSTACCASSWISFCSFCIISRRFSSSSAPAGSP